MERKLAKQFQGLRLISILNEEFNSIAERVYWLGPHVGKSPASVVRNYKMDDLVDTRVSGFLIDDHVKFIDGSWLEYRSVTDRWICDWYWRDRSSR